MAEPDFYSEFLSLTYPGLQASREQRRAEIHLVPTDKELASNISNMCAFLNICGAISYYNFVYFFFLTNYLQRRTGNVHRKRSWNNVNNNERLRAAYTTFCIGDPL